MAFQGAGGAKDDTWNIFMSGRREGVVILCDEGFWVWGRSEEWPEKLSIWIISKKSSIESIRLFQKTSYCTQKQSTKPCCVSAIYFCPYFPFSVSNSCDNCSTICLNIYDTHFSQYASFIHLPVPFMHLIFKVITTRCSLAITTKCKKVFTGLIWASSIIANNSPLYKFSPASREDGMNVSWTFVKKVKGKTFWNHKSSWVSDPDILPLQKENQLIQRVSC